MNYAERFRNSRHKTSSICGPCARFISGPAAVAFAWACQDSKDSSNASPEQAEQLNQIETEQP